jgi:hypothetical protein
MPEDYSIKLTGPGLEISRGLDQDMAFKVVAALMGKSVTAASERGWTVPRRADESESNDDEEITVGEFIGGLNVTNNAERIAAIALFTAEKQDERLVPKEDLPMWFQRSGEAPPRNLTRDLKTAIARKLVSEDHARAGYYFVTKTGTQVLRRSAGDSAPSSPRQRRRRAGKRVSESADSDDASNTKEKPSRRKASKSGTGPTQLILAMKSVGWFKTARTVQDIIAELSRRGAHHKRTDLTRLMQTLIRRGDLHRAKQKSPEGGRSVWMYSAA